MPVRSDDEVRGLVPGGIQGSIDVKVTSLHDAGICEATTRAATRKVKSLEAGGDGEAALRISRSANSALSPRCFESCPVHSDPDAPAI